jgi:hypothetical protein
MITESRLEAIEKRLSRLERGAGTDGGAGAEETVVEMNLVLPEACIDGLRFNKTEVRAVFKKKEDGCYHSKDILFLSARNTEDDNSRDILTEYLNLPGDNGLKEQIAGRFDVHPQDIEISLPKENEGVKRYNGARQWYWTASLSSGSAAYFCSVYGNGHTSDNIASAVGGCAIVFSVG